MGTLDSTDKGWPTGESGWLKEVPWGFRKLLNWIKVRYDNPLIIVTENGVSGPGEDNFKSDESVRFCVFSLGRWLCCTVAAACLLHILEGKGRPRLWLMSSSPIRLTHPPQPHQALDDTFRQGFMRGYIAEMYKAIKYDEVNVKGYFYWSLMDVSLCGCVCVHVLCR